jgi:site-specific DNA recombinase
MGVELTWTFDGDEKTPNVNLNLGDLETLTEQLNPQGAVLGWQSAISGISGMD